MLTKQQKINLVKELGALLKANRNIIFVDFAGLTMSEQFQLKRELKKHGLGFKVVKKTLLELALKDFPISFDFSGHKGSLAFASGSESPEAMAKIIYSFGLKNKRPAIIKGFLLGREMAKADIVFLAQLPPREILLAQFLQLLMSPVSGLARVIGAMSNKMSN